MSLESQSVFLIYGQLILDKVPEYFALSIFDDRGQIEPEVLEQHFQEFSSAPLHQYYTGPFSDMDSMSRFAFNICQERGRDRVRLISSEEFNQVLESVNDRQALINGLENVGQSLENLEAPKKGLLGKLFR